MHIIHIYIHIYTHIYTHICTYIDVCVENVDIQVRCIHSSLYFSMHLDRIKYIHISRHSWIHTNIHIHTYMYLYTYVCIYIDMYT